jgi:hypothetical protein
MQTCIDGGTPTSTRAHSAEGTLLDGTAHFTDVPAIRLGNLQSVKRSKSAMLRIAYLTVGDDEGARPLCET